MLHSQASAPADFLEPSTLGKDGSWPVGIPVFLKNADITKKLIEVFGIGARARAGELQDMLAGPQGKAARGYQQALGTETQWSTFADWVSQCMPEAMVPEPNTKFPGFVCTVRAHTCRVGVIPLESTLLASIVDLGTLVEKSPGFGAMDKFANVLDEHAFTRMKWPSVLLGEHDALFVPSGSVPLVVAPADTAFLSFAILPWLGRQFMKKFVKANAVKTPWHLVGPALETFYKQA